MIEEHWGEGVASGNLSLRLTAMRRTWSWTDVEGEHSRPREQIDSAAVLRQKPSSLVQEIGRQHGCVVNEGVGGHDESRGVGLGQAFIQGLGGHSEKHGFYLR